MTNKVKMDGNEARLCHCDDGHWRIAMWDEHEVTWVVYTLNWGELEEEVTFGSLDEGYIHPHKWTGRMRLIDEWPLDNTLKPLCEVLSNG